MPLKAVVFDLDGTLIDSRINYELMAGKIRRVLSEAGIAEEHLSDRRKIYHVIRGGDQVLTEMGIDATRRPQIKAEMERIMNQVELEGAHLSKPMRNAKRTLRTLRKHGLGIGVATRGCREYALKSMELTGIYQYIDKCLARDEVPYPKPDPRHLLELLTTSKLNPRRSFTSATLQPT